MNDTGRSILAKVINGIPDEICGRNATYFEGTSWYCGWHAPSKVEGRQTKSFEKWRAQVELYRSRKEQNK